MVFIQKATVELPKGYHTFHTKQLYNFQFNRWYSLGFARYEDMQDAGQRIKEFSDWKPVMVDLAKKAEQEKRWLNAAIYYRGAEFYISHQDQDKLEFYNKFLKLFYNNIDDKSLTRYKIPYADGFLPAYKITSTTTTPKGTLIMHGGFDSFIEEFYYELKLIAEKGYNVIAFEGPGQGGARRLYDLAWDEEWEKPTTAIIDYFKLNQTILYGISMGGHLCLRAAAYEPRITHVITSGGALDYLKSANLLARKMLQFFLHFENFTRRAMIKKMKRDGQHKWFAENSMYIANIDDPLKASMKMLDMKEENAQPQRITQDVLVLSGRNDNFIPFKMHKMLMKAFPNARSVTGTVFTKETRAQNHCQIGNIPLAVETIINWLEKTNT